MACAFLIGGRVIGCKKDPSSDHHCRLERSHKSGKRSFGEICCGSWVSSCLNSNICSSVNTERKMLGANGAPWDLVMWYLIGIEEYLFIPA